jgi:hypothetical protein
VPYSDLLVRARRALLDAVLALDAHRDALVLVGAQAIYLYTGDADVEIATTTRDSDLAVIPQALGPDPLIAEAMAQAGFHRDAQGRQGLWLTPDGVEVELLVPAGLQPGRTRGARIPPHDPRAARRVAGLEAAAVDNRVMTLRALDPDDDRSAQIKVAGPAALVVAKTHKIADRLAELRERRKDRLADKDAHDVYRLLRAVAADEVVSSFDRLLRTETSRGPARAALGALSELAASPASPLCVMAGRAEELVGDPEQVAAATWALVQEILERLQDA